MREPIYPTRRFGENWDDYQDRLGSYYINRERWEEYWEDRERLDEDEMLWKEEEDD